MNRVKVLFFAADPSLGRPDNRALELAEELRRIQREVGRARYGHRLVLEAHGAARADDLMECLESTDARVVHFSGHGGSEGLVLVAPDGHGRHPVDAESLRALFRTYRGPVRLAVLSACSSHAEAQAIADVIGCAIGTSSAISDDAAITFNSRFYRAVANGHSVRRAFDEACMALRVHRVPRGEHPELVVRRGVDPAALVLVKTRRLVPARVAAAAGACALTAASVALSEPEVVPELTASDVACGAEVPAAAIRPLAGVHVATSTTPPGLSGAAADLADAKALYQARNYARAAPLFERAASAGNGEAMGCLGFIYLYGRGVQPRPATGVQWLRRGATEERDPHAMYALAIAYLNGAGTRRAEHLAGEWLEKAAAKGYAEAMRGLGSLLREEKDAESDRRALDWYRRAVEAGSVDAKVDVGSMYEQGRAVPRDPAEALRWYHSAARAGSPRGMFAVGRSYEQGIGVQRDYARARAWYLKAARAGSADAMNSIGALYERGLGVRRSRGKAIRWYRRAAEAGSLLARGNLGAAAGE